MDKPLSFHVAHAPAGLVDSMIFLQPFPASTNLQKQVNHNSSTRNTRFTIRYVYICSCSPQDLPAGLETPLSAEKVSSLQTRAMRLHQSSECPWLSFSAWISGLHCIRVFSSSCCSLALGCRHAMRGTYCCYSCLSFLLHPICLHLHLLKRCLCRGFD